MMLDRDRARRAFAEYTRAYDPTDPKVRLKIEHTYRVAALCEQIARSLSLSAEDTDTAWLAGLLHDVGRFEQLRRYGTFEDARSIDHAACSEEVLFVQGHIRDYLDDASADVPLRTADVTPAVLDAFYAHHAVLRALKRTPVDNVVGHASLVYELVYPESLREVSRQGYIWQLLDFKTENPDTARAFAALRDHLHAWLEEAVH